MSIFKREINSFSQAKAATPYQKAAQEWDMRLGDARVQAYHWRLIGLVSLGISILLLLCLLVLIAQKRKVVYVAEVSSQGRVISVKPLADTYNPSSAEYQYFIGHFIELTMSLPLDPVIVKQNWLQAYQLVSGHAERQFSDLANQLQPFANIGKLTQTVQVENIQQITPNSYSADWTQTSYDQQGKVAKTQSYSGVFTVSNSQPSTQQEILINPLGIHINYFTITDK